MRPKDLALICCYSEEEKSLLQVIQSSFDFFLKKELQNVAKHLRAIV